MKQDLNAKKEHAKIIFKYLSKLYPNAKCELNYSNAFELLIATILSAQCTDTRVNIVTKELFKKFPTAELLKNSTQEEIEKIIQSTGLFRTKAKNIFESAKIIVEHHAGKIPSDLEDLQKLPGVGRKTANVVLGNAFNIAEGIVVDTHVIRLSKRLGLTKEITPEKIELDLIQLFPKKQWINISHLIIFHGRRICNARNPKCNECVLSKICPSYHV